jgi:hypothetical protein
MAGSDRAPHALPDLPPVPAGPEPFFRARGLAALIAALDDAVISHHGASGDAVIVVVGGRVLDAVATLPGQPLVVGLDALNAIGSTDAQTMRAATVDRRLALALPSYWREPDRLPPIPVRWVDPAGLVEAIVRKRHRGVVALQSASDLGLALFDESGLVGAYSQRQPHPGGLDVLAGVMASADTVLHARIADAAGHPVDDVNVPLGEERVAALPDPVERCRGQVVDLVEGVLHLHAEPVVARFRAAPATTSGLLLAAEEVRKLRLRLISPVTMASLADRAEQIIRAASRAS